jgi:hypothetical protein
MDIALGQWPCSSVEQIFPVQIQAQTCTSEQHHRSPGIGWLQQLVVAQMSSLVVACL